MNIRMYNCYFGDCFLVKNTNGNDLMVDFGIHKSCVPPKVRESRFDVIYSDICVSDIDFLLSHYHEDHYNGVLYVNSNYMYQFKDVYIPDIWSFDGNIAAINLHLLRGVLDKSFLNNKMSIFDFLKKICNDKNVLHFVQRGSNIQDKYIALWPSEKYVNTKAMEAYKYVKDKTKLDDSAFEELEQFAKKLQRIVLDMHSRNYGTSDLLPRLESLEEEFKGFVNGMDSNSDNRSVIINLRRFENDISIVFQNKDSSNDNLIFTGDFGNDSRLWDEIEMNCDGKHNCDMHMEYHTIKVGHHGTRDYYHSFKKRMNSDSILMIPNGGKRSGWDICSDYSLNVVTANAKAICSMDKACEAKNNNGNCTCPKYLIIEPGVYNDII